MLEQANIILKRTGVDKLPSLPHVLLKVLDVLHNDANDITQLTSLIRTDSALFTRFQFVSHLSSTCDTSFQSLEQSLNHMGIDTIKNIINTSAVQQFFSPYSLEKVEFLKQHWQHSILCAELAQLIAQYIGYKKPDDAYTAGLIHDVGQLSLESAYPSLYTTTFAQLSEDEFFHDLETEEFDTTHHQVSALLLRQCGIHHAIIDAVLYHHEASTLILDAHPLVKVVNLANQLSSSHFKKEDAHVFEIAHELFDISQTELTEILQAATHKVSAIAQSIEMNFKSDGADGDTASKINGGDELKQVQLAEQVRNIALFGTSHQLTSPDNKYEAVKHIEQQAALLFSVSNVFVFEYDKKNHCVTALTANAEPDFLDDLSIPLKTERSIVAAAFLNISPCHSFDENNNQPTVIDQQLAGLSDAEGLLCIPIQTNSTTTGVLVFALSEEHQKQLWKQRNLLTRFANSITQSLTSNHGNTNSSDELTALENNNRKIAHEIRNPLSVINNYLEVLSYKLDEGTESQQNIDTIKSEITRIGGILEKLSAPSTPTDTDASININNAINDLTQIFLNSLADDKSIKISLELDEDMPHIISDINAIKQIYTNIIKNAIEALPTNGQILVYTSSHVNVNGEEFIEISIADNGPGIADTVLPELFSPVQTTKGDNHSGLGLNIVKDLVSDLNGTISCKSNTQGTSFHILLPKKL